MYFPDAEEYIAQSNRYYDFVTGLYRQFYGEHFHICLQEQGESREAAMCRMNEMIMKDACVDTGDTVVDLGGGIGSLSMEFAERFGCSVTCVNINDHQLSIARRRARRAGLAIDVVKQDIMNLQFDKVFDAATLIDVDSHLPEKRLALDRILALIRPGGRFVMTAWLQRKKVSVLEQEFLLKEMRRCIGLSHLATFSEYRSIFEKLDVHIVRFDDFTDQIASFIDSLYRDQLRLARSGISLNNLARSVANLGLLKSLARGEIRAAIDDALRGVLYMKTCYDAGLFQFGYFVVETK